MIKCLLVDDEMISREGLCEALDWTALGIEIVGMAKNGQEGLALFQERRPDIVISDVKMPIMDGIAMVEQIIQEDSTVKIILLSAYSEFAYAQQAIRLGVRNYLLKPVDDTELLTAVKELSAERKEERQREKNQALLNLMRQGNCPVDANHGTVIVIDGIEKGEATMLGEGFFEGRHMQLHQVEKNHWVEFLKEHSTGFISDLSLTGELMKNYEQATVVSKNGVYWQLSGLSWPQLQQQQRKWNSSLFVRNQALEAIVEYYPQQSSADHSNFFLRIKHFLRMLEQFAGIDSDEIWRYCYDAFLRLENHYFILGNNENKLRLKDQFRYAHTFQELASTFRTAIEETLKASSISREHEIISRIKRIIQNRYQEDISSKTIAEEVFLSPNYMGQLFRDLTGYYLNDYILEIRMNNAKKYLSETRFSIAKIASLVGISSSSYFTSLFKKRFKQTPKEFRRLSQKIGEEENE